MYHAMIVRHGHTQKTCAKKFCDTTAISIAYCEKHRCSLPLSRTCQGGNELPSIDSLQTAPKSGLSKHAFREVAFGFRRGTVPGATLAIPDAPRVPKNKSKGGYLVPAQQARLYCKVLIAKCFPRCTEGPYQGQPLSPRKCKKNRFRYQG